MKRKLEGLAPPEVSERPDKKLRTETHVNVHGNAHTEAHTEARTEAPAVQPAEQPPVALVSSEPKMRVLPAREGSASSAQSANASVPDGGVSPAKRIRFQLETGSSRASAMPIPVPAVDPPRTPTQMIDEGDLRALRGLLQGAARGWSLADKAAMLRHAAGAGKLNAFNLLLEFGALQVREESPRNGRQSLLEYVAWGQNPAILDRLVASGLPLHGFQREQLIMAIALSARKGGMDFLQRLCAAADAAGIRFQPADMRRIFVYTVQWEKNEQCLRVSSPDVMEWLMARYPGSFDASVFVAPIWKAIDVGNWPAAEYLLGVCGVSANLTDQGGRSLLMASALRGRHGLYELLCFHDADPHAIDASGQSVLHYAVQGPGQRIVSDLVLQHRVDTDIMDVEGKTPTHLALQQGRAHLVDIIQSQPLDIDYLSRL